MKNIFDLMKEFGLELPEDKKKDFEKALLENYKTAKDYDTQKEKLDAAEGKVAAHAATIENLKADLKKFEGVDVTGLQQKITDLEADLQKKDDEYNGKIAERDFSDLLSESIRAAKGKNEKAIKALLDLDTLRASKNQKDDVAAALKTLTEAEDSSMLFGSEEDDDFQIENIIGKVTKKTGAGDDAALRAAMGLAPEKKE